MSKDCFQRRVSCIIEESIDRNHSEVENASCGSWELQACLSNLKLAFPRVLGAT